MGLLLLKEQFNIQAERMLHFTPRSKLYMFHFQSRLHTVWYLYCLVSYRALVPTVIDLSALISTDSIFIPCTWETADTLSIAVCLCILSACVPRRKTNPARVHACVVFQMAAKFSTDPVSSWASSSILTGIWSRLLTSTCGLVKQRSWKLQTLLVSLAQR